uniref:Uncharacterized protein n=1 Tax=Globodera pallida TaxID=36090 RepID=A0A183CRA7_GLOPA
MPKIVFYLVVFCICIILLNNLVAAGSCFGFGRGVKSAEIIAADNHCKQHNQADCGTMAYYATKKWILYCGWNGDECITNGNMSRI